MKLFWALLSTLFLTSFAAFSQVTEPVKWSFSQKEIAEGEYELRFVAKIEKGWYVYAQDIAEGGPVPTSFMFEESDDFTVKQKIEEKGKKIDGFDKFFNMEVAKYKRNVRFYATVKSDNPAFTVKGSLEFMTCSDKECLPPDELPFKFDIVKGNKKTDGTIGGGATVVVDDNSKGLLRPVKWDFDFKELGDDTYEMIWDATIQEGWNVYSQDNLIEGTRPTVFTFEENNDVRFLEEKVREEGKLKDGFDSVFEMRVKKFADKLTFKRKVKLTDSNTAVTGNIEFITCDNGRCLPPEIVPFSFSNKGAVEVSGGEITGVDVTKANEIKSLVKDCDVDVTDAESDTEGKSILTIFLLGFLGGFAALLTPCVFPMIPMTVSFFTKQSKTQSEGIKNAIIYALSIIVIYVSLGYLVTMLFGAETMNELSTGVWFNLAFFVVFVVFAFSFFGYYEITLPNWIINKSDAASDKGGLLGIFFMAFTLALVSFSCTGPIIGTLLVEAVSSGSTLSPVMGMTGFAVALALPFALFAAFPGWMNSMPKSGGWLGTVKVVLGFIELIFALKFLSNADLVAQWGLLKRETFLIIWIILFVLMGAYLFTWLRFKYDQKIDFSKLGIGRWVTGAFSFIFAGYLVSGLFCGNLSLVSGFPPPTFYAYSPCDAHDGEHNEHIKDLSEAMALAKKEGKPVMIDFTGWACVSCRQMEENVWTKPSVAEHLDDYIIASLYVDEKIDLPEDNQFKYQQGNRVKKVKTVGNKWSFLEFGCYNKLSQPYYVLVNEEGELLGAPRGYTPDVPTYAKYLEDGLAMHKAGKSLLHN